MVKLENELARSESLSKCDIALKNYLSEKNISTFSFTYYTYHPQSVNKLKYDMCSENFLEWHQYYLENQFNDIDSTLKHVYRAHLPIYWNLKQQLAQASNEVEKKMRLDSIEFGAESGLSVPVHGAKNNFAILLLVQMQGDKVLLNTSSLQHELFLAAHLYYHYLQAHLLIEIEEPQSYSLTQREMQCLYLVARQYSVKEMSQYLELSERTINFHIQKLNKKLGTKNKYQSLSKVMELGLMTL